MLALGLLFACDHGGDPGNRVVTVYPDAEAYSTPPDFTGAWQGQVERKSGKLQVGQLRAGEYFGNFSAADGSLDIALYLEQSNATTATGASLPSNRLLFTWQDGNGERGHGWLKIDRGGRKLEGASGFGEAIEGFTWSFTR